MQPESDRLARVEATLEHIKEQMDRVVSSIASMSTLQVQQDHQRDTMGRMFDRLEDVEKQLARHEEADRQNHDALSSNTAGLRRRIEVYVATVMGVFLGGGCVWGVVAWTLKNDVVGILNGLAKAGGGR